MALTRCYQGGKLVRENFPLDEISECLDKDNTVVWVDLAAPDPDELELLAKEMNLHVLAIEDALEPSQRPKLDEYPDHLFLSAYYAVYDSTASNGTVPNGTAPNGMVSESSAPVVSVREIAAFITPRALITVHPDKKFDFTPIMARWDSSPELARYGVSFLLHGLLDVLVDGYFDAVQALDDDIEDLEGDLFQPRANQIEVQRRTFDLRKSLVQLRRVVLPMREVINTLLRRDLHFLSKEMDPYFQDVYDHVLRATEWTESLRELVSSILDANLAAQGNRLNVITKKVTGWAAIIAIPTAVTGFYGQNLPYPGFGHLSGFYTSSAIIVVGAVVLYLVFRRKDWI